MSACAEHVTNYFAIFAERGGQMFCLYSFYISSNCIKHCNLFVKKVFLCSSNDLIFSLCMFSKHLEFIRENIFTIKLTDSKITCVQFK